MKIKKIAILLLLCACSVVGNASDVAEVENLLIGPADPHTKTEPATEKEDIYATPELIKKTRAIIQNTTFPKEAISCETGKNINLSPKEYYEFKQFIEDKRLKLYEPYSPFQYSMLVTEIPDLYIMERSGKNVFCVPNNILKGLKNETNK